MTKEGFLEFLVDVLDNEEDNVILSVGLDCLRNILEIENDYSVGKKIKKKFLKRKGFDCLERLEKNKTVREDVHSIIDIFF